MTTRRGFLGKLAGLAAAPLAKKVEVPQAPFIDKAREFKKALGIPLPRLMYGHPQNIGTPAEGGMLPPIRMPDFPVSCFNPGSEPVTETYCGVEVTVPPRGTVRLTLRDRPIDVAHDEALQCDAYFERVRNLQPEEPEFYDDEYEEED